MDIWIAKGEKYKNCETEQLLAKNDRTRCKAGENLFLLGPVERSDFEIEDAITETVQQMVAYYACKQHMLRTEIDARDS